MKKKQYKLKITYIFTIICSILFLFFNSPVHASGTRPQIIRVSPIIINVPLSPGKLYNYEINVENLTDKALPLQTSFNDFQTTGEEGGYVFEDTRTNPLLSWIKLSDNVLILNPNEKKKIKLTINTPKSIPLGGYYGILFFQPVLPSDMNTTHVVSRIGVLMLADIGVPDPKAKKADILTYTIGLFHQNNQLPVLLRVKNVSLHYFTAKPILTISPLITFSPQNQNPMYLEDKILFQGKVRRWEQAITLPNAQPNLYIAHMAVSTGNGQYVIEDKYFILFPFTQAFIILLVIVLVIFLTRKRKRLKKTFEALSKNG